MPVQVQQEQLDPCHVALTIDVPPEDIQKAISSVFQQFAKRANVPGFRPGKAPVHLVKRFIDEGRVREVAMEQALTNAYRDALRQTGVAPYRYAEPEVQLPEEEVDPERGFSFKATIALQPQVELGDLEGFTARRVVTRITEEDVTRELDRIREQGATYEPTDQPVREGDRIRAVVEVTADGELVPGASFTEPTLIEIGANLKQFDSGLLGTTAGEEKTFEFAFPEDFVDEALQGKTATTRVSVSEAWRRAVPEPTDDFAKRAGFDDLETLRTRIQEALQRQADALSDQELNESLIQELVRRSRVHFPDEMLEHQVSERMADLIKALERRSLTLDDYLAAEEIDLAELQERFRENAKQGLTNTLIILEFSEKNEIKVSDKEVEDEVRRRAEAEEVKVSQMRRLLNETGEMSVIRHRLLYRKVAEFLRERANIREVES
jgi:trigger factor